MSRRTALAALLTLAAAACRDRAASPADPSDAAVRSGTCRCYEIGASSSFPDAARAEIAKRFLEPPNLPPGWSPATEIAAPKREDPLWLVGVTGFEPSCASVRDYDTPGGRRHLLVIAYEDEKDVASAAQRIRDALKPLVSPPIATRRSLTLMVPGEPEAVEAWMQAGRATMVAADPLVVLSQLAEHGQRAKFDEAFAAYTAAHPDAAMPWAYRAKLLLRLDLVQDAGAAAEEAIRRAEAVSDAAALSEARRQLAAARERGAAPAAKQ